MLIFKYVLYCLYEIFNCSDLQFYDANEGGWIGIFGPLKKEKENSPKRFNILLYTDMNMCNNVNTGIDKLAEAERGCWQAPLGTT